MSTWLQNRRELLAQRNKDAEYAIVTDLLERVAELEEKVAYLLEKEVDP